MFDEGQKQHESMDIHVRRVLLTGIGLVVLLVAAFCVCALLIGRLADTSPPTAVQVPPENWQRTISIPDVQPNQAYQLRHARRQQQLQLSQYAWVDEDHAFARIPIERAMQLLDQHPRLITHPPLARHPQSDPSGGEPAEAETEGSAK